MSEKIKTKNDSKSRRGFLGDFAKLIGGTAILASVANLFSSNKVNAEATAVEPYLGQIMLVPYNFAPRDWAFCHGQLLPINGNEALFSLLGTNYGGDGRTTFGLPDLRSRVPIGEGQAPGLPNYNLGTRGGEPTVTLTTNQLPAHNHSLNVNLAGGNNDSPGENYMAHNSEGIKHYSNSAGSLANDGSIANTGSNLAHNNMQPYIALNYVIATVGVFPPRN